MSVWRVWVSRRQGPAKFAESGRGLKIDVSAWEPWHECEWFVRASSRYAAEDRARVLYGADKDTRLMCEVIDEHRELNNRPIEV